MNPLHLVFAAELIKLSEMDDVASPDASEIDTVPEGRSTDGEEESIPQESIFSDVTPHDEATELPPAAAAGTVDARDSLETMLSSTGGRRSIRDVLNGLKGRSEEIRSFKQAFTRALVRSFRNVNGPSPTPRKDLRALLFTNEPNAEARYV